MSESRAAQSERTSVAAEPADGALVAAVAAGDAGAFRALVDRHAGLVHRLAFRLLGDRGEAEDVTQDTFLKLWTGAGRWRAELGGGRLPPWLRRVATNLCLDRLRRRKFVGEAPPTEPPDERPMADAALAADDLANFAARAVGALPERQRAAVVLTYQEGLSNAAAAAALDMNVKAFESLLLRARGALRTAMTAAGWCAADLAVMP